MGWWRGEDDGSYGAEDGPWIREPRLRWLGDGTLRHSGVDLRERVQSRAETVALPDGTRCRAQYAPALTLYLAGDEAGAEALLLPLLMQEELQRQAGAAAYRVAHDARVAAEEAAGQEAARAASAAEALRALLWECNRPSTPAESAADDAHRAIWGMLVRGRYGRVARQPLPPVRSGVTPDTTLEVEEIPWISRIQDVDPVPLATGLDWLAELEEGMGMESVPATHPGAVPGACDWSAIAELAALGIAVHGGRIFVAPGRSLAVRLGGVPVTLR